MKFSIAQTSTLPLVETGPTVELSSGSSHYAFQLALTKARTLTPEIELAYNSSNKNDLWGMGFSSAVIMTIQRSTNCGVPTYQNGQPSLTAFFVHSHYGQLVTFPQPSKPETTEIDGLAYKIEYYQPRRSDNTVTIEYYQPHDRGQLSFWIIREHQGKVHVLGDLPNEKNNIAAIIKNPANPNEIFQWNIRQTFDAAGNKILFEYDQDLATNPNLYPQRILYGNYQDQEQEQYAFEILFQYAKVDQNLDRHQIPPAIQRPDIIKNYRAGFLIETQRLCFRIELRHIFKAEPISNALVRYWEFEYGLQSGQSVLRSIQSVGRRVNRFGEEITRAQPLIEFEYSSLSLEPIRFQPMQLPKDSLVPASSGDYHLVDLYKEGLPGILCVDNDTLWYWRSNGSGAFADAQQLTPLPVQYDIDDQSYQLTTLGNQGELALVVTDSFINGYYRLHANPKTGTLKWDAFSPFDHCPVEVDQAFSHWIDLNGNGQADLLILDSTFPCYYPGDNEQGFKAAQPLIFPNNIAATSPLSSSDPFTLRAFAELFGDGLLHRIELNKDTLTVWPNLGHGIFDSAIQWPIPVYQGDFSSNKVQLADVRNTGASDLIYIYPNKIDIFFNKGNGFMPTPISVFLPADITLDESDKVSFGDLLGDATTAIFFTKFALEGTRHYYAQLAVERSFLLKKVRTYQGNEISFDYSVSTKDYLNACKDIQLTEQALPYPILPFAVPVIEKITCTDKITGWVGEKTYKFHGGNYDFQERFFCGFTFVEEWQKENNTDPQYTKRWFSVGSYQNNNSITSQHAFYASAYFPLSITVPITNSLVANDADQNASMREAMFALRHRLLRIEIYAESSQIPYSVVDKSYAIFITNSPNPEQPSTFIVLNWDSVVYTVEQQIEDNRIERTLFLKWNDCYQPTQQLNISYGRMQAPKDLTKAIEPEVSIPLDKYTMILEEQQKTFISYHVNAFRPLVSEEQSPVNTFLFNNVLVSSASYDLSALEIAKLKLISTSAEIIYLINQLTENQLLPSLAKQLHLYYWNNIEQQQALGLHDRLRSQPLLHHTETLLGNIEQVTEWFKNSLLPGEKIEELLLRAGHQPVSESSSWWQPSIVYGYYPAYRLLRTITNIEEAREQTTYHHANLWTREEIYYEHYWLRLSQSIRMFWCKDKPPVPSITSLEYDYQCLNPICVKDPNGTTTINLYDPLNQIIATTRHGKIGEIILGSPLEPLPANINLSELAFDYAKKLATLTLSSLLENIDTVMENWVEINYYQFSSATRPTQVVNINRFTYRNQNQTQPGPSLEESPKFQITIQYFNGFNHNIQTKQLVDSPPTASPRWLDFGFCLVNNQNLDLESYLPSYVQEWEFNDPRQQSGSATGPSLPPVKNRYDALGRFIEQITPKGYSRRKIFTAWAQFVYDENDTLAQRLNSISSTHPAEKASMKNLATFHQGTPTINFFNAQGYECSQLKILKTSPDTPVIFLLTRTMLNAQNQVMAYFDPRLAQPCISYQYDLCGNLIIRSSSDQEEETFLYNRDTKVVRHHQGQWLHQFQYDNWQREILKQTRNLSSSNLNFIDVQQSLYGEQFADPSKNNLCDRLVLVATAESRLQYLQYDMDGNPLKTSQRIFLPDLKYLSANTEPQPYKTEQDLGYELLELRSEFSVLGDELVQSIENTSTVNIHGSYKNSYNALGQLRSSSYQAKNGNNPALLVPSLDYCPNGQYASILHGNGVCTKFGYDEATLQLSELNTYDSQNKSLLSQHYLQDPVGNMVQISRSELNLPFEKNITLPIDIQPVLYDSLYRITQTAGVELAHAPIQSNLRMRRYHSSAKTLSNDDLQPYTTKFSYDIGDNITNIQHQSKTPWHLSYDNAPESNHLNRVTLQPSDKNIAINYNSEGSITAIGNEQLSWDPAKRLVAYTNGASSSLEHKQPPEEESKQPSGEQEFYGYTHELPDHFSNTLSLQTFKKYSPAFFGGARPSKSSQIAESSTLYETRQYKISQQPMSDGSIEITEILYLVAYQRKRIYQVLPLARMTLILERYSYNLKTELGVHATFYHWSKDSLNREVKTNPTPDNPEQATIYHILDHLGSIVMDLDSNQQLLAYQEYSAYGTTAFLISADETYLRVQNYDYSSKEQDSTGLYYYGDRYYDPQLARWLNPDPGGLIDSLNPYTFVGNNPTTYRDWNGDVTVNQHYPGLKVIQNSLTLHGYTVYGVGDIHSAPRPRNYRTPIQKGLLARVSKQTEAAYGVPPKGHNADHTLVAFVHGFLPGRDGAASEETGFHIILESRGSNHHTEADVLNLIVAKDLEQVTIHMRGSRAPCHENRIRQGRTDRCCRFLLRNSPYASFYSTIGENWSFNGPSLVHHSPNALVAANATLQTVKIAPRVVRGAAAGPLLIPAPPALPAPAVSPLVRTTSSTPDLASPPAVSRPAFPTAGSVPLAGLPADRPSWVEKRPLAGSMQAASTGVCSTTRARATSVSSSSSVEVIQPTQRRRIGP